MPISSPQPSAAAAVRTPRPKLGREPLLSVNAAHRWLKDRGYRVSRHAIYGALARRELAVAAQADRVILIRERDLLAFAEQLPSGADPLSAKG